MRRIEAARLAAESGRGRLLAGLEAKTKDMEHVLNIASHDLRTPLLNVVGFTRMLEKHIGRLETLVLNPHRSEAEQRDLVQIIHEQIPKALEFIEASGTKMDHLINALLRFSRAGRAELKRVEVDMNAMIKSIIAAMEFSIEGAGASVEFGSLPPCRGDTVQLNQVFSNLVDNAIKYRDPERPLKIRIAGRMEGGRSFYEMSDTGKGMKPDQVERVWDLFYRAEPEGGVPGEGLGLPLARRIVERHGGGISVRSNPGEGTVFMVELPAAE
jgi:signal transduction histidine kinase